MAPRSDAKNLMSSFCFKFLDALSIILSTKGIDSDMKLSIHS